LSVCYSMMIWSYDGRLWGAPYLIHSTLHSCVYKYWGVDSFSSSSSSYRYEQLGLIEKEQQQQKQLLGAFMKKKKKEKRWAHATMNLALCRSIKTFS